MGNTTSQANAHRSSAAGHSTDQPASPSTAQHNNRDLSPATGRKKSLELPDLASISLSSRPKHAPPKPIPIPTSLTNDTVIPGEAGRIRPPVTLPSLPNVDDLSEVLQPSNNRPYPPISRQHHATVPANSRKSDAQHALHMHEESRTPSPPQRTSLFVQELVHSSVPLGLNAVEENPASNRAEVVPDLVCVKITWRGGGNVVQLARASDDDWKGRTLMERESPGSNVHHATISLPPGTHHIRFLIDDHWQVADDYPTAVDDQGTLANYVSVPISYSPPIAHTVQPSTPQKPRTGQSFWSVNSSTDDDGSQDTPPASVIEDPHVPQQSQAPRQQYHHHHQHSSSQGVWTSRIPPELTEAAHEEERYVEASTNQARTGRQSIAGFVPAPNVPPAPNLPRHLDKLILNSKPVIGGTTPTSNMNTHSENGAGGSRASRNANGRDGRYGTPGTPTGRSKTSRDQRGGRGSDRERDRGRDRRDAYAPPPPPPPSMVDVEAARRSPGGAISPSHSQPESPVLTPREPAGTPSTIIPASPVLPTSTSTTRPLTLGLDSPAEQQGPTDDGSVLPVPSHVVLHHLSTSAIRNGVLAVADSTRYRKKYLTTIYYKPTGM